MELLNEYDSILQAEIASHIYSGLDSKIKLLETTKRSFFNNVEKSHEIIPFCKDNIPAQWNVSISIIEQKLSQLFTKKWTDSCWSSFEQMFNKLFK